MILKSTPDFYSKTLVKHKIFHVISMLILPLMELWLNILDVYAAKLRVDSNCKRGSKVQLAEDKEELKSGSQPKVFGHESHLFDGKETQRWNEERDAQDVAGNASLLDGLPSSCFTLASDVGVISRVRDVDS